MDINDVIAEYERIRTRNLMVEEQRRREVYAKAPELEALHQTIRKLQMERIRQSLLGGPDHSENIAALKEQAGRLLTGHGFDAGYLEPLYTCPICQDTGVLSNGAHCACFQKTLAGL